MTADLTEHHASESLSNRLAWKALKQHHDQIRDTHLRQLFADDPGRGERFTVEAADFYFDYSKNRIINHTINRMPLARAYRRDVSRR